MSRKRIHELAKEWRMPTKSLLAKLEELGIRGKKAPSQLAPEEEERLKRALGGAAPLPARVPAAQEQPEKVVSEREVTQREEGSEEVVTAKERVVERRVGEGIIRRRVTRV